VYLSHLSLRHFRNYARLELDLAPGLTVLVGDNGQGKSNLLEALYLLATSRSPRAGADRELISWSLFSDGWSAEGAPVARVAAEAQRRGGALSLALALQARAADASGSVLVEKHVRINGVARRATALIGGLIAVLFRAQDVELVGGSPSVRRRYLDATLSPTDPRYLRAFQRYQRVLLQRNHLLRRLREAPRAGAEELAFWDHELITQGAYLLHQRVQALTSISAHARAIHSLLTGDRERLGLLYVSSVGPIDAEDSEHMTVARFEAALAEAAPKERAQAVSLVGPHRDDLRLTINDVDLHQYGSHGQQRTAALSLRLAEARYLAEATGETPVLLLDDALAELDAHRRGCLLALASEAEQCLLAVTDADRVADVLATGATAYRIEGGRASPLV